MKNPLTLFLTLLLEGVNDGLLVSSQVGIAVLSNETGWEFLKEFVEIGILGFHELYAKIISIKTIKDLKYFSWCAMNLKCLKV